MDKKMNLFYILKLNTSYIVSKDCNIKITYEEANQNNFIVALGDNQLFQFVRRLTNNTDILNSIEQIKSKIKRIKKEENNKQNIELLRKLEEELVIANFVPEIISIKADTTKKDYKYICKNTFSVEIDVYGKKYHKTYKRLCAGAGQLRRNSALFCDAEIYNELETIMMCGLTRSKIGKINLAKFSAYFALYTSAARQVKTPRICVVDDYEYTLKNQTVDWIYEDKDGNKDIEERIIDFEINAFDGSGMISPKMANTWKEDLGLDYLPSSFIVRSAWIKGLVSIFDFHKFAREIAHKDYIEDIWGEKYNIDDVDVILTKSQFKLWKKYDSWQQYVYYHKKFHHIFSVARVNKKEDNLFTTLNYQYIQTNDFTTETIKGLADYSVNWANKIMSKDYLYTILLLSSTSDFQDMAIKIKENSTVDDKIVRALLFCPNIINDKYINQKIIRHIQNKIDKMKIGKVWVEGAYEFIIPDLYAMAEHAFGLDVKGLLPEESLWSRRWVNKGSMKITAHRSPLVAPSENRILNVYNDARCEEWYQYIQSGNIMNIHDMTVISMSDADYDGDIILTTDNPYMVNAVKDNKKIITYEKKKTKEQLLNANSFATMDTKSFNSKIGVITNIASNMISLKSIYKPDSDEYKELDRRIRLLRFYQGTAIDATKGDVFVPPPKYWSKKQKFIQITDDMTEEQKQSALVENKKIAFNNRIAVDRKAYFFGYIYPRIRTEYDIHVKMYKDLCNQLYHMSISQLSHKENKTQREQKIIKNYYKYMPLLRNNCTMNLLSYYIEDIEFDNKWKKSNEQFDYTILYSKYFVPTDKKMINKIRKIISEAFYEYNKRMRILHTDNDILYDKDYIDSAEQNIFIVISDELKNKLYEISSNSEDIANYTIYCFYNYFNNKSKAWLWNIFGDNIVEHLKSKVSTINIPVESQDGSEYLGRYYKLEEVSIDDIY